MSDQSFQFLWGAATSSHQIEGYNEKNDWWAWELEGNIEGGARSGAATDHWNRFREDIKLAADLGLNSYRFSLEWSRVEPDDGEWSREAFDWYKELISECEKNGLVPMLTLHHFTSPQWFALKGGFAWSGAPDCFARYVRRVARELGARVPLWCTFNEPMVLIVGSYLAKFMPPAEFSPQKASQACRNILESHVMAYDLLHAEIRERSGPWKSRPIGVGIAHNLLDFQADRKWHPLELLITKVLSRFYNQAWLDAITGKRQAFGIPGLIPKPKPVIAALDRLTCDFIGVNYYTKAYVKWRPKESMEGTPIGIPFGLAFSKQNESASDLGWAIHPSGFGRVLNFVARYQLPIYITENGIADREDRVREDFISSHLREVASAIERGIDVRGYYHWSLLDNFEWIKGFGPRFGLYAVNYENFARRKTTSAESLEKIISAHRDGPILLPPNRNTLTKH